MPATSLLISHHEMRIAQDKGNVRQLCRDIPEIRKWYGAWWLLCGEGWLRITDSYLADRLNRIKMRLDTAEETRACRDRREDGPLAGEAPPEESWPAW